jgi:Tol biopolymer transport system component
MRIRRLLRFSFPAALAGALLLIGSAGAASASSKRIAFVSGGTLWTALPNGAGLTNLGVAASDPSISTDGGTIYFAAGGVFAIPAGGGAAALVCAGGVEPAISPSGAQLAYASGGSIFVGPSTGCGTAVAGGSDPAWSPDSRQLTYVSGGDVFVAQADGSGATNVTNSGAADSDPAWSPSGADIAFVADGELRVMSANGSNQRLLTSNTLTEANPSWSADGAEIVFARDDDPGAGTDWKLYAIQVSDSSVRIVTGGEQPDWGLAVANTSPPTMTL